MEKKGYLSKIASPDDGRVTYISITEEGWKLFHKYDEHYFGELSGELSDISEEDAENAAAKVEEKYPDIDVELQMGGQPIYYYIVSVE